MKEIKQKKDIKFAKVTNDEISNDPFLKRILDRAEGKTVNPIDPITGEVTETDRPSLAESTKKTEEPVTLTPIEHSCNGITVTKEKNESLSLQKIYQWASNLTTEQKEETYSWTPDALMLRQRLLNLKGCFIAVIGFQGIGKTALRQALYKVLANNDKKVLSLKWTKNSLKNIISDITKEKFNEDIATFTLGKLFDRFNRVDALSTWATICKKAGLNKNVSYSLQKFQVGYSDLTKQEEKELRIEIAKVFPVLFKLLTVEERESFKRDNVLSIVQLSHTILIDLPDYSRQNINQLTKDLNDVGEFWENYVLYDTDNIYYGQRPNVVLFFQKELFKGHFLLGKMDTFEIKPFQPAQFVEIMQVQVGTIEPFTREALLYLGSLSRGIFRRFKKYVRICLEEAIQHGCNSLTVTYAKNWISFEQLEKDMELELMTVFPKRKELRKASVILLQLLREKGELTQQNIAETVFDNAKMKCSRVLDKLEAWNYIERTWVSTREAHIKKVKLKESV